VPEYVRRQPSHTVRKGSSKLHSHIQKGTLLLFPDLIVQLKMATNGKDDPLPMDVEANEETGLIDSADPSPDPSEMTSTSEFDQLWAELDQPWPATFERSVSLLASPVLSFKDVDLYTKSPKPGNTPLASRRFQVCIIWFFFLATLSWGDLFSYSFIHSLCLALSKQTNKQTHI
jgi:hypothetical protein